MTRVALFEWTVGGHRPVYVRRFVEALRGSADVLLALPDRTLEEVGDLNVETLPLGEPRPPLAGRLRRRHILAKEVGLLRTVASRADRTIHLFGDHALFQLAWAAPLPGRVSLLLYYPRWHYWSAFRTRLPTKDLAVAYAKELAVRRWRRRSDAGSVFTLDEELAKRWMRDGGAPTRWLPEPPVAATPVRRNPTERHGYILYGALSARKGLDALRRALTLEETNVGLVIAGSCEPGYRSELEEHVAAMSASGVLVDLRAYPHSEEDALDALASARCAILPYPRHPGMSRVLLEACVVGTPVIADRFGLLGHLVRTYRLGLVVDCHDARSLRRAVLAFEDPDFAGSHVEALDRFAARFTPDRFRRAVLGGLGISED